MSQTEAAGPNADQIEFWNETVGDRWVARQELLDSMIGAYGDAALDRAAPRPGEAVLDIGCGCGATVLATARRLGGSGAILGVDISRPMLSSAEQRAAALPAPKPDIQFQLADAQTAPLGATRFDLAFSRFGVMFFADPTAAFRNIRAALKPAGRLAFACWRALDENPWMKLPLQIAFRHVPPPPRPGPEEPGPFSFADPARVTRILEGAGFRDIALEPFDHDLVVGATTDLDEAIAFSLETGPLVTVLAEADAATRAKVTASLREGLAPHHSSAGLRLPGATWIVTARV